MKFYWLIVGALVVWRITFFFHSEDGPWKVGVRLRRLAGNGFWGELLDCFYCLSFWIALPFAVVLGTDWRERLLLWPAFSGAASLLQKLTHDEARVSPPLYREDPEIDHGLLRTTETTIPRPPGESGPPSP